MKHYTDGVAIWGFEEGDVIPESLTEITMAEVHAINEAKPKTPEEIRKQYKQERDIVLNSLTYTFTDGSVIQTRPQDMTNFEVSISDGVSREWIMADNSIRVVTIVELQEALTHGISESKRVWAEYIAKLKTL